MTFSIVARCTQSRMFGVAIASSSPAVAARCAHARSGAGAVATQNITDPSLGPRILDSLELGATAVAAMKQALVENQFAAYRQVLAIAADGAPVIHSGANALGVVASAAGSHSAAAGNLLANAQVPGSMVAAFEATPGSFAQRLLSALIAGIGSGGEAGPIHSAGMLVVREVSWPIVDLRVDWSLGEPVSELAGIWRVYEPQIDDYVRRAVDPRGAPSFGVPGNS
jgi:uncharacterized Ntn-hydrolase superfamily protein